jgi:hypothetical protein
MGPPDWVKCQVTFLWPAGKMGTDLSVKIQPLEQVIPNRMGRPRNHATAPFAAHVRRRPLRSLRLASARR